MRCADDRTKLCAKMLCIRESEPDCAQTERRVLFAAVRFAVRLLGADIEGSDLYSIFSREVGDLAIRLVLLTLSRKTFEPVE